MFGRRTVPFGSKPPSPPSGGGVEPFPIDKMDRALEAAIILLTRALDDAGVDPGRLAIRAPVPSDVGTMLAQCTTYCAEPDGRPTYLALGITPDFKQFSYPPHCRLFMILNAVGIAEDPTARTVLNDVARSQFRGPLVDAWMMRAWVGLILQTNDHLAAGSAALDAFVTKIVATMRDVAARVPADWALPLHEHIRDFAGGFPGTIGKALEPDTRRMNGLPVTPFIEDVLIRYLADLQSGGLQGR